MLPKKSMDYVARTATHAVKLVDPGRALDDEARQRMQFRLKVAFVLAMQKERERLESEVAA